MNTTLILQKMPAYIADGNPSKDTISAYTKAHKHLVTWCEQRALELDKLGANDAINYVHDMYTAGLKRESINQRIAGNRAFYRTAIALEEYHGDENPFDYVHGKVSHAPDTTNYFTPDEMKLIYHACETDRERALILLMGVEGLRTVEITRLEITDVDLKKGRIKVHGKGNNDAYIYPSDKTQQVLAQLIGQRKRGSVFTNDIDGKGISRGGVKFIVNHVLRLAGVKKRGVSCHALRHSCGTNLYAATKDIRLVQETLRHQSPQVTARYTHVTNRKNATNVIADF